MPGFLRLLSFLDILAHKNPGMRILQLDSGIVPLTRQMINSISTNSKDGQVEPRYAQFHITGSFKEGLDSVQEACQSYAPWLGFYELDIEKDLEIQGFSNPGTYDLIVASTVRLSKMIHSRNILSSLANCFLFPEGVMEVLGHSEGSCQYSQIIENVSDMRHDF